MYSATNTSTNTSTHAPQQGPQGFSPLVDPTNFEIDSSGVRRNGQRRRPGRGPPPPKTTLAALLMLFVGTILLCVGLGIRWHTDPKEKERGLALIILGTLCKFGRGGEGGRVGRKGACADVCVRVCFSVSGSVYPPFNFHNKLHVRENSNQSNR